MNFLTDIENARTAAPSLSTLINRLKVRVPGAAIRLLSHSLGAEVLLAGLELLAKAGQRVDTAIMMEAAVPASYLLKAPRRSTPIVDSSHPFFQSAYSYAPPDPDLGRYAEAPAAVSPLRLFDFYSQSDTVLRDLYSLATGQIAIGLQFDVRLAGSIRPINTTPGGGRYRQTCIIGWCFQPGVATHSAVNEVTQFYQTDAVIDDLVSILNHR